MGMFKPGMIPNNMSLSDRFWTRVSAPNEQGCWLWLGAKDGSGYGRINDTARPDLAHRVSYRLNVGAVPPKMYVCHRCDVPSCVNPEHLFLGTPLDNMHDCVVKGRHRYGTTCGVKHYHSTITPEIAAGIRLMYADGRPERGRNKFGRFRQVDVARAFGVSRAIVNSVVCNRSWACQT